MRQPGKANPIPFLRVGNLTFAYEKEPVLKGIDLEVREGEFIGIIGPNGSGKSTLLKLLAGVLPLPPASIYFRGRDLGSYKRKLLARSISWIPQENPVVFPFKVSELVMMGRHPYQTAFLFETAGDHAIVREAMRKTGTLKFSGRYFNEISSGERQRVMIASAIAQEPETMLLDEPTSALDLKYQMEILKLLKEMNGSDGLTVALALHDLHLASKFCRRLILLDKGRIVRDGPPDQVLLREILEKVYEVKVKIFRHEEDGSLMISPEL